MPDRFACRRGCFSQGHAWARGSGLQCGSAQRVCLICLLLLFAKAQIGSKVSAPGPFACPALPRAPGCHLRPPAHSGSWSPGGHCGLLVDACVEVSAVLWGQPSSHSGGKLGGPALREGAVGTWGWSQDRQAQWEGHLPAARRWLCWGWHRRVSGAVTADEQDPHPPRAESSAPSLRPSPGWAWGQALGSSVGMLPGRVVLK